MVAASVLASALALCTPHTDAQFQACLASEHPGRRLLIEPDKGQYIVQQPMLLHNTTIDGLHGVKLLVLKCAIELTSSDLTVKHVEFVTPDKKPLTLFCRTKPKEHPGRGNQIEDDLYNGGTL